jgi:hypothetical protein
MIMHSGSAIRRRWRNWNRRETMNRKVEHWAPPIAGILFVVLMVVGSMLVGDVPAPDAPEPEIAGYLTDSATHTLNIVGAYLWVVGALAFLWFLSRLRGDLRRAEGGTGVLSNLTFGAGVAFAAVWMVCAAAHAWVPYAIELRGAPVRDTDLAWMLPSLGRLLLLLGGGFAGVLVLLAASAVILRTGAFPRWLAWLGIVAAIVLLFDVVYQNIFSFWAWVLIASIVMLMPREQTVTSVPDSMPGMLRGRGERVEHDRGSHASPDTARQPEQPA